MKLTLTERKAEAPNVESFIFTPEAPLAWKAGQFIHYVLHHEPTDDRGSDRWFTIAAAPSEGHVMITTRFTDEKGSSFKKALAGLKIGDTLETSDIAGDGDFTLGDPSKEYVLLAGGIGVTPFRSILVEAAHQQVPLKVTLLWGNRDEHIPYRAEFDALAAQNPNLHIAYLVAPEQLSAETIKAHVPDLSTPVFYLSGPEPMVESLGKVLKDELGIPAERIKQDWFPGYTAI